MAQSKIEVSTAGQFFAFKKGMKTYLQKTVFALAFASILISYNNCGKVTFENKSPLPEASKSLPSSDAVISGDQDRSDDQNGPEGIKPPHNGDSVAGPVVNPIDDLTPLVKKAGVVTILLALGDELNDQLVIKGASSQTIAEMAVRYASPVTDPKILVVRDSQIYGESVTDTKFIADVLLKRYNTKYIVAPADGLSAANIEGYDLIWFNNPGYPVENQKSRDTLLAFKGGVILSGDDISQGKNFSMSKLTGLNFIDNGTSVTCGGKGYRHDNNGGYQFAVGLLQNMIPGVSSDTLSFSYGNDIDNVSLASNQVEIIAYAVGGHSSCWLARPTITRYERISAN